VSKTLAVVLIAGLGLLFAIAAAAVAAGVASVSGGNWLSPAALACFIAAFIVHVLPV
jgi:hypothetical protein